MNAHINHDLPVAVVSTCAQLATSPAAGTHLAAYRKVDQLLDAAEQSVRQSFESAPELAAGRSRPVRLPRGSGRGGSPGPPAVLALED